ncbi:MAG: prepilin-type N-terminal cleavage/methylation domain-containing protein [Verrucomicrobiota bacterium]
MKTTDRRGFTFTELLVVIAVMAALAGLLLPTLASSKGQGDTLACMNNINRLILAWQLYAHDNNGRLVMNFHGGTPPGTGTAPWTQGWLDWSSASANTNILYLVDERYAKLAAYMEKNPATFKCPADRFLSPLQKNRGWARRCRSYSVNIGIGDGNAETGPFDLIYRHIKTTPHFIYPGAAETWVFTEEHPDSVNDPGFFNPVATNFVDVPGTLHNGAAGFAFADGHYELHKWKGALASNPRARRVVFTTIVFGITAPVGDPDLHWLSYRAGRASTNSY